MPSVLQDWVHELTLMQQSVLITAVRGPDGLYKNHIAKLINRFLRRSFLKVAFTGETILDPYTPGGGSFTGPWPAHMQASEVVDDYLHHTDEIPHHYHLHIVHAAEILGYKHPDLDVRGFWEEAYRRFVNDMHLSPETEERMDWRLGDQESQWRAAEEVTAL